MDELLRSGNRPKPQHWKSDGSTEVEGTSAEEDQDWNDDSDADWTIDSEGRSSLSGGCVCAPVSVPEWDLHIPVGHVIWTSWSDVCPTAPSNVIIPSLCNVKCPGNSSQFCGGDSWYTFHLMYLWVALVEAICSGMSEPVGNNMPMCASGQHLASHEPVL